MRIQSWLKKALAGVALACTAQSSLLAQGFAPGNYDAGGVPFDASGGYPAPVQPPPYGTADPQVMFPAGMPQTFQPWPAVSPYQSANIGVDQHVNRGGLWFQNQMFRRREFYGSVEGMAVWFHDAGTTRIGSPYHEISQFGTIRGVDFPPDTIGGFPVVPTIAPGTPGRFPVSDTVFPFPALDATVGTFNSTATISVHPIHDAGVLGDPQAAPGVQFRWGFEDEDGTGMQSNTWWAFEGNSDFQRGSDFINDIPVTQALTLIVGGQNLSTQFGNIPLDNGEFLFPDSGTGSTAKYDVMYRLEFSTEAGGSNLSYYMQPLINGDGFKVRPSIGARYMYLSEGFKFRGIDSGFNYDINATGAGGAGGGGQQGGQGGQQGLQLFTPVTASMIALYDQYEATLSNNITSHLAGPEVGLRFDLGNTSDGFKIWGESNFALVANYQKISLSGENIGDPLVDARFNGNVPPRMLVPGTDATFAQQAETTHVSPMFQQSIFANMKILDDIPLLRESHIFQNASLRLGYTFTVVGLVARPVDSVHWQGFPLFPQIRADYKPWSMHTLNAGIDWNW